jgi:hypothetical protein
MFDLLKKLRKAHIDIPMPRRPQELLIPPAESIRINEGESPDNSNHAADKSRK